MHFCSTLHSRISIADKALLNFCSKLNAQRSKVDRSDIEALRTFGLNDQQILEAIVTVGFAQLVNTVAFGLGTVPDFAIQESRVHSVIGTKMQALAAMSTLRPWFLELLRKQSQEYSFSSPDELLSVSG